MQLGFESIYGRPSARVKFRSVAIRDALLDADVLFASIGGLLRWLVTVRSHFPMLRASCFVLVLSVGTIVLRALPSWLTFRAFLFRPSYFPCWTFVPSLRRSLRLRC
jgi:hypothetical protein